MLASSLSNAIILAVVIEIFVYQSSGVHKITAPTNRTANILCTDCLLFNRQGTSSEVMANNRKIARNMKKMYASETISAATTVRQRTEIVCVS